MGGGVQLAIGLLASPHTGLAARPGQPSIVAGMKRDGLAGRER